MKIGHTILIGCGGMGGWAAEPLARLLRYHPSAGGSMTLVDGDTFEDKNRTRQRVDLGSCLQPKVGALAKSLARALPWRMDGPWHSDGDEYPKLDTVHQYVDGATVAQMVVNARSTPDEATLIVFAVDNSATVVSVLGALDKLGTKDPWIAAVAGNSEDTAMLTMYGRVMGQTIGQDPRKLYENFRSPTDRIPGGGCSDVVEDVPQTIMANLSSATGVLCAVTSWLDGKPIPRSWSWDCRAMKGAMVGNAFGLPDQGAVEAAAHELAQEVGQ